MSSTRVDITVFPRTDFAAHGWEFAQADADVQAWFPAVHTQTQQFRSRTGVVLDPRLLRIWDDLAPTTRQALEPAVDPATWPALQQLLNSFRAPEQARLQPQLQQYVQSLDWIRQPLGLEDQEIQIIRQLLTMLVGR